MKKLFVWFLCLVLLPIAIPYAVQAAEGLDTASTSFFMEGKWTRFGVKTQKTKHGIALLWGLWQAGIWGLTV